MKNVIKTLGVAASLLVAATVTTMVTGCSGDSNSRSTGTFIDDTAVSTKVKTQLLTDKGVKGTEVSVRTYNGEVQLSGFVDSDSEKSRAGEVARLVPGVKLVHNDLVVKQVPVTAQTTVTNVNEAAGADTNR